MKRKKTKLQNVNFTLKNFYRKPIVPLTSVPKLIAIALAFGFTFNVAENVHREIKEAETTENIMVTYDSPFGSVVLKNNDTRDAIDIYSQAIDSALNAEGVEDVFNENLTKTQKKQILENIVLAMAESSHIPVTKITYVNDIFMRNQGLYVGNKLANVAVTSNSIYINSSLLKNDIFAKAAGVVVHEMIHAIENLNTQTNKFVLNLDDELFAESTSSSADKGYYSSASEITAYLLQNKFMVELYKTYADDTRYEEYGTVTTLYKIIEDIIDKDKHIDKYYKRMTMEDILAIGLKNNLEEHGVNFDEEDIKNKYTFDIIRFCIPQEYLELSYSRLNSLTFINSFSSYAKPTSAQDENIDSSNLVFNSTNANNSTNVVIIKKDTVPEKEL